jgi:hypothetical protein
MTTTLYSHALRLIVCANCGAPMEVEVGGGQAKCRYCDAVNMLAKRDETRDIAQAQQGMDSRMSEAERLDVLRSQDNRPIIVPPSLERYLMGGLMAAQHVQAASADWRWTCRQVQEGAPLAEQDRLFHLTLMLCAAMDDRHERALLENALEVLPDPRHRQILRCNLAHHAVMAGDLPAAHDWLKPCNPRPTDLRMDTAFRLASSYLATAEGHPRKVLALLGSRTGDVPIADGHDEEAELLRANAIERDGHLQMAVEALQHHMRADMRRIATMRNAIYASERLRLCQASFPAAFQIVWQQIDRAVRPTKATPLGCMAFGCLIPIGGSIVVGSAILGLFGTNPAVVVNAVVHPLIWLVLLPVGVIIAASRSRKRTLRLRDHGKLTFARVGSSEKRIVSGKNSTTTYQDLLLDIELDGKLYRTTESVVQHHPVPLGSYPVLVDPENLKSLVLKLKPLR